MTPTASVRFGDLVQNVNAFRSPDESTVTRYIAGEHLDERRVMVTRWGSSELRELPPTFKRRFASGQTLLHSRNPRKVAMPTFEGITGEKLFVLEPTNGAALEPRLLPFMLRTARFEQQIARVVRGSVNKYLNWTQLADLTLPRLDLEAQGALADLLWGAVHHEGDLRAAAVAAAGLRSALVRHVGSQHLNGKTLDDVVAVARAGGTPSRREPAYFGGDIPWLKSGEVRGPGIAKTEESITESGLASSSAWKVPSGATVVAMYGAGATRGQVGQLAAGMATNQAVLALLADPEEADSVFLYYWTASRRDEMRRRAAGAAQPNLSKKLVLEEPFPDLSVARQQQASRALVRLDELEARLTAQAEATAALVDSISEQELGAP